MSTEQAADRQPAPDALAGLSDALEAHTRAAAPAVVAIDWGGHATLSALLWRDGEAVTSDQSLPDAASLAVVLPDGGRVPATLAGRDPATNIAVLRLQAAAPALRAAEPSGAGALALALGRDGDGAVTARLGSLDRVGPAWQSQRGGRIDRLIQLGLRLPAGAEGGPVIDARGGLLGMSTFGPRRSVLVIPAATIARVAAALLASGRVDRGWLGVGLHPVALPRELVDRAGAPSGLMVVGLADNAPAAAALLPGDILLEAAGKRLGSARVLAAALADETIGNELELKLIRGGELMLRKVVVAVRPA
jgi:S1-C subfamily serine protease